MDGTGAVYIADTFNNRVVVDKPNGSGGYTQSVVDDHRPVLSAWRWRSTGPETCSSPTAATAGCWPRSPTDPAATRRAWSTAPACSDPRGVAVDGSGDVYIADIGLSRVVEDKPNGSGGYTQSTIDDPPDVYYDEGVAADDSGDVFITDTLHDRVVEHSATSPDGRRSPALSSAGSLTVAFRDASIAVSPATITRWSWNFGDGSPASTEQNPSAYLRGAGDLSRSR